MGTLGPYPSTIAADTIAIASPPSVGTRAASIWYWTIPPSVNLSDGFGAPSAAGGVTNHIESSHARAGLKNLTAAAAVDTAPLGTACPSTRSIITRNTAHPWLDGYVAPPQRDCPSSKLTCVHPSAASACFTAHGVPRNRCSGTAFFSNSRCAAS